MTDRELMQQALEALDTARPACFADNTLEAIDNAITALRSRLAQPEQEFIKHHGDDEGWSDWVCPDPDGYLMKCCDCGLVHEAQFGVVRYTDITEKENCDMVDDPNLQAVFRMRRSEQWTPKDTAYRPGGLAQPEQEPVAWADEIIDDLHAQYNTDGIKEIDSGDALIRLDEAIAAVEEAEKRHTAPPQRKPLTHPQIHELDWPDGVSFEDILLFARAIEAAHGIKEKNT